MLIELKLQLVQKFTYLYIYYEALPILMISTQDTNNTKKKKPNSMPVGIKNDSDLKYPNNWYNFMASCHKEHNIRLFIIYF